MKYQISYLSPSGNCKKLAYEFDRMFQENACVVDLEFENDAQAQIHLIGFEMNESSFKAIPYKIMELLDRLENKSVLFFVTCPFKADDNLKSQMERALIPFLPENCDYRGLYLCSGQATDAFQANLRTLASQRPDDEQVKSLLASCQESIGHPDEKDLSQGCKFVAEALL